MKASVITLEITDECPMQCAYCYRGHADEATRPGQDRSVDVGPPLPFPVLLGHLKRLACVTSAGTIQIAGGEPLRSAGLLDWIREIRALGLRCTLLTDGGLLTDAMVASLSVAGLSLVQPTLLGDTAQCHDALKGAGSFQATVAGVDRLITAGVPVSVAFVATALNAGSFRGALELCFALGARTVAFSRYTSSGDTAQDRRLEPSTRQIRACLETAQWGRRTLGMQVKVAISLPHCVAAGLRVPDLALGHCALAGDRPGLTLDPHGNLRACAVSRTVLGNLTLASPEEILARAEVAYFPLLRSLPPACQSCGLLQRCRGGCRESAVRTAGVGGADPLSTGGQDQF
jgi:radical SAM protein with 4Fe4S-binding SPASM domain